MAPTCRRRGCPRACGVRRTLCRHTVWVSLLLWLPVMPVTNVSSSFLFSFDWCSVFSFNSIQIKTRETMPGIQASAVPQGDGRRPMLETHSDMDQPAATHRGVKNERSGILTAGWKVHC
ncbi:retrotransposon hot spot protein (RHS) [Trypanosoma cruzi]|nr:retrotransposon hot spot protein (RHS) [Trypanosoma cruzi]